MYEINTHMFAITYTCLCVGAKQWVWNEKENKLLLLNLENRFTIYLYGLTFDG